MTHNVFSVPIFFIVFRETLEAAIIVSVLLGLVEQIVHLGPGTDSAEQTAAPPSAEENDKNEIGYTSTREAAGDEGEDRVRTQRLIRKMRFQESSIPTRNLRYFVTDKKNI
jgi:high-affinity iron transporter